MKNTKKIFVWLLVLVCLVGVIPTNVDAGNSWTDLGSGWRIRLDGPHDGGAHGKWHVHVENNNGSIKGTENVDGTPHDGDTMSRIPKKVLEKARKSKPYSKGKENQKKTDAAKKEIRRRGLNWRRALDVVAIIAILALFGLAIYFTGGLASLAVFA